MSIRVIDHVWRNSKQEGGALLLLLAIADYAHDDGRNAYPSLKTLARKTRLSRRHIINLIKKLEDAGELVVDRGAGPDHGTGPTHRYQIIMGGGEVSSPPMAEGSELSSPPGVKSVHQGGEVSSPKPSCKPSLKPSVKKSAGKTPQKKEADPAMKPETNPPFRIYREVTGSMALNKTQRRKIFNDIGKSPPELSKWRDVVEAWNLAGYKPTNISGMLDWYRRGIPQHNGANRNGSTKISQTSDPNKQTFADEYPELAAKFTPH
jgi:hypothetical protein